MYQKDTRGVLKHLDFMIINIISLQLAFFLAYIMRHGLVNPYGISGYRNYAVVITLIELFVAVFFNTFSNVLMRGVYREFAITVKHVLLVELFGMCYLYFIQSSLEFSRITMLLLGIFFLIISLVFRLLWKWILKKGMEKEGERSLLIVTNQDLAEIAVKNILDNNFQKLRITGLVIIDQDMEGKYICDIPVVANRDTLLGYACREWVDEIFFKLPELEDYPQDIIDRILETGIAVHIKLFNTVSNKKNPVIVERLGNYTVMTLTLNYASPLQLTIKRLVDIAGGLVGCLLTLVLIVIIGPMIKKESPGPIFFSQVRIGKNGRKFKMYKFRSMYLDAEERKKELMAENRVKDGMMFKLDWDPRIIGAKQLPDGTFKKGIGNYIRDWSLDEFPQFFNILKGDMSLVGTRPPTVDEWEKYELHHRARLAIRPGLTGMWQVSGRSNITDFEEVVKLDREYICNWSMGLDFRILFQTVQAVFVKDGAM